MAKEQFTRTKPHVNMTMNWLAQRGFSFLGIQQLASGQIMSDPNDRLHLAAMMSQASINPSTIMLLPRMKWEYAVSLLGAQQIAAGQVITSPADRLAIAALISQLMPFDNEWKYVSVRRF